MGIVILLLGIWSFIVIFKFYYYKHLRNISRLTVLAPIQNKSEEFKILYFKSLLGGNELGAGFDSSQKLLSYYFEIEDKALKAYLPLVWSPLIEFENYQTDFSEQVKDVANSYYQASIQIGNHE